MGPEYAGRAPDALFSTGVERAIIRESNAVLDGLFSLKSEMARRTEEQLGTLFRASSTGRNRLLGPTAEEASSYFDRACASGTFG